MKAIERIILFTTGDSREKLERVESRFRALVRKRFPFEASHLGRVADLGQAYHDAAGAVRDDSTALLFSHQDAFPAGHQEYSLLSQAASLPPWFAEWTHSPPDPLDSLLERLNTVDCGIAGVAGAKGLLPGIAWWNYPDLSGAILHLKPGGRTLLNPYGPWGPVAVLDGLFLAMRADICDRIGPPKSNCGFHFYDLDLSLRALKAGLKNYTIPLLMWHESGGAACDDPEWIADRDRFLQAWEDDLPVRV